MMSPQYELISTPTASGDLHGIVARASSSKGLVVHVHGTWGNFYGNPFINSLARAYLDAGFDFAALNFPGHDETAVDEKIQDFPEALNAWVVELGSQERIILQGHSLGAVKIAFLAQSRGFESSVSALSLLAPFDVVAFYSRNFSSPDEALSKISHLSDSEPVPESVFDLWSISAGTLRSALVEGGSWDQFPFRHSREGSLIKQSVLPTFFAIGGNDFAATPNPQAVYDIVGARQNVKRSLIANAPHNFAGQTEPLANEVSAWVANLA